MNTEKDFQGYDIVVGGWNGGRYATTETAIQAHVDAMSSWISDASKEACGIRMSYDWNNLPFSELDRLADSWQESAEAEGERQKQQRLEAAEEFEANVTQTIALGAGDRSTAIRWLFDSEGVEQGQYEELAYKLGLSFNYFADEAL